MTRVAFFHTTAVLPSRFEDLAAAHLMDVEWYHIVDESVLDDMLDEGALTPGITERICSQLSLAARADTDVILDTCSSTSPAVDVARQLAEVPIVKIDDPMSERAVELGDRIAVVATAASTLDPSREIVEQKALAAGRDVSVETILVDDAFDARRSGDVDMHDQLVNDVIAAEADDFDVFMLAQASMSHLDSPLSERIDTPVLSSPTLAMERVAELVDAAC